MISGSNITEEERIVLDGFLSDSQDAAKAFFERYLGIIRQAVRSVDIHEPALDADDLVMEAVAQILDNNKRAIRLFKGGCKFTTYLYTICRRTALKIVMREDRHPPSGKDSYYQDFLDALFPNEEAGNPEKEEAVRKAVEQCDSETQIFIKMVILDQKPVEEVMRFFGWNSANTVYARKNKVLAKLKKYARKHLLIGQGGNNVR